MTRVTDAGGGCCRTVAQSPVAVMRHGTPVERMRSGRGSAAESTNPAADNALRIGSGVSIRMNGSSTWVSAVWSSAKSGSGARSKPRRAARDTDKDGMISTTRLPVRPPASSDR